MVAQPTNPETIAAAFTQAFGYDSELVAGIAAYRCHPYRRTLIDPPVIWSEGPTRLLDYGGSGPTIVFVPSLINRAYILDLAEDASFLRYLAAQDTHPLLVDWGWPGGLERDFTLTDYIAGRLERMIQALDRPVILAGYCMGGLLALAAAIRLPSRVSALALLATPWDFHAENAEAARSMGATLSVMEPMMRMTGTMPIDALQMLFATIDPFGVTDKYRDFARLDPETARARRFVALEDWLNDGVPLPASIAREAIAHWYGENAPACGAWRIAGLAVDPARIDMPVLCAIPERDRLVPPASSSALAALITHATCIRPNTGHIGMIAGVNAPTALWQPFLNWVRGL
ncbi:alpha/beta fold hydrolase [Acidiphilium sp.]|uniref:alpha/beta fold hydrolase n=1 Tax=Acidiphilium sp. TaxID=527 RepID=UPI003D04F0D5